MTDDRSRASDPSAESVGSTPTVTGVESDRNRSASREQVPTSETVPRERTDLDYRGWVLVGLVIVALVVVPVFLLLYPPTAVPFLVAYLVIPLGVAILLGIVAVWSVIR